MKPKRQLPSMDGVIHFLRYIGAISGGFLLISAIGLVLSEKSPDVIIAYVISICANAIVVAGAFIAPRLFKKKKE